MRYSTGINRHALKGVIDQLTMDDLHGIGLLKSMQFVSVDSQWTEAASPLHCVALKHCLY